MKSIEVVCSFEADIINVRDADIINVRDVPSAEHVSKRLASKQEANNKIEDI